MEANLRSVLLSMSVNSASKCSRPQTFVKSSSESWMSICKRVISAEAMSRSNSLFSRKRGYHSSTLRSHSHASHSLWFLTCLRWSSGQYLRTMCSLLPFQWGTSASWTKKKYHSHRYFFDPRTTLLSKPSLLAKSEVLALIRMIHTWGEIVVTLASITLEQIKRKAQRTIALCSTLTRRITWQWWNRPEMRFKTTLFDALLMPTLPSATNSK